MLSFMGLAVFFLAVTIPLVLSREWITVSWAIQALVMLWLADKLKSAFLRQVAFLLYGLVLVRFGLIDLPAQYSRTLPAAAERSSRRLPVAPARAVGGLRRADRLDRRGLFPAQVAACGGPVVGRRGQRRAPVAANAMGLAVLDHPRRRNGVPVPAPRAEPQPGLSVRAGPAAGAHAALAGDVLALAVRVPGEPQSGGAGRSGDLRRGRLGKLVFFDLPFWGLEESFIYDGELLVPGRLDASDRLRGDRGLLRAGVFLACRGQAPRPRRRACRLARAFPDVRLPDSGIEHVSVAVTCRLCVPGESRFSGRSSPWA